MMDLRRLQVLRVLADQGTVVATARTLHVTPSAVSQQIRQLAIELGVELLHRDGRNVRLTPAAVALLKHADGLHRQWEHAKADIAVRAARLEGTLRFCGVSSAIAALLPHVLTALRERMPELHVHVAEMESEECFQQLLAEQSDIGVILPSAGTPPVDDPRFSQRVLHEHAQDLLVPSDHPLAHRGRVRLSDAATESWIVQPYRNDTYDLLVTACASAGFSPRITHHVKEWFAVSALVAAGSGVCLLPRIVPIPLEHAVTRVPLHGNPRPVRRIVSCVRRGSGSNPMIASGLEALRESAATWPGAMPE